MNVIVATKELESLIKLYFNKDVSIEANNQLIIKTNYYAPVTLKLNFICNDHLEITFNSIKVGIINLTALIRKQIFKILHTYNTNLYKFDLQDNKIIFKIDGFSFKNITLNKNINIEVAVIG